MKIHPISDIHLDLYRDNGQRFIKSLNPNNEDITLVIAGDVSEHSLIKQSIKLLCERYPRVVYVPGNHEFWHSTFEDVKWTLGQLNKDIDNFYWLYDNVIEISGVRFLGATLWFQHTSLTPIYAVDWCDFIQIDNLEWDFYVENGNTRRFLEQNIRKGDVVVTHHSPSNRSCPTRFIGNPMNIFYVNQLDALIEDKEPALWIHGHMHESCDYTIGNTRIICNPLGYIEETTSFNSNLILTI